MMIWKQTLKPKARILNPEEIDEVNRLDGIKPFSRRQKSMGRRFRFGCLKKGKKFDFLSKLNPKNQIFQVFWKKTEVFQKFSF